MGFFDALSHFISVSAQSTADRRAEFSRQYERKNPGMDSATRDKFNEFNRITEKMASVGGRPVRTSVKAPNASTSSHMGKTIAQWDQEWGYIGYLKEADLSTYNHSVGLYRHVVGDRTMYIGKATELGNGGLRKRLSDYRRDSGSARGYQSGQTIYEHLNEIETYVLVVGNTTEAVDVTRKLEGHFISKYNPPWNKRTEPGN